MKTIGLIGGMSWESTVTYYKIINEQVKETMGGFHSAKCILYSVDFHEIEECQKQDEWERAGDILGKAAFSLQCAGADFVLICTNTMHKVVEQVKSHITIPLIHIAEVTADRLEQEGIKKVALLGTKYTMQQDFYKQKLIDRGIEVMIPNEQEMEQINGIIFNELCMGSVKDESKNIYLEIIRSLQNNGAQGVILGCTEIGMLIAKDDVRIPLFDTTVIHATAAVNKAF